MAEDWQALKDWVLPDGTPNLDFLANRFGAAQVPVHDSGRCAAVLAAFLTVHKVMCTDAGCVCSSYGAAKVQTMSVEEYAAQWKAAKAAQEPSTLYLKDWHCAAEFPDYQVS